MKKFQRIPLIALGTTIALLVMAFLAANLYLQSDAMQERIRKDLSRRLGVPVKIAGTSLTPWGGFRLTGVSVPPEASPDGKSELSAKGFTAHLKPLALLRRELVIGQVVVDEAVVVWVQNGAGRWQLPGALRENLPAKEHAADHGAHAPSVALHVDRFKVRRCTFSFRDKAGKTVADLERVNASGSIEQENILRGRIDLTGAKFFNDAFHLSKIRSPFTWDSAGLTLPELSGELAGGKVKGDLAMQPTAPKSPFQAHARLDGVDINQLIKEGGGSVDKVRGKLRGTIELDGRSDSMDALHGGGELTLSEGVFEQYELLQMIGQALQLPELVTLKLRQGTMKYRLEGKHVLVDELTLQSDNLRLTSQGSASFDRDLSLHARLAINDEIARHFSRAISNNFATDENGVRYVDFDIKGTLNRPRTDLVQRVVGNELQRSVGNLIENLLGPKKKKDNKDKKKKAAEQPATFSKDSDMPQEPAPALAPAPAVISGTPSAPAAPPAEEFLPSPAAGSPDP